MKPLYAIIFILLISQNMSEKCDEKQNPSSISDCKGLEVLATESVCCFLDEKYTMNGEEHIVKSCKGATKSETKNIIMSKVEDNTTLIKEAERKMIEDESFGGKVEYINVNCKSNYLFTSLMTLIIVLLL